MEWVQNRMSMYHELPRPIPSYPDLSCFFGPKAWRGISACFAEILRNPSFCKFACVGVNGGMVRYRSRMLYSSSSSMVWEARNIWRTMRLRWAGLRLRWSALRFGLYIRRRVPGLH